MPARVRSVKVWVNAFIPAHIPGFTTGILSDDHQGETMILGPPGVPVFRLSPQRGQSALEKIGRALRVIRGCATFE